MGVPVEVTVRNFMLVGGAGWGGMRGAGDVRLKVARLSTCQGIVGWLR